MLSKDQAKALADKVLSFSSFPECDVSITETERSSIRFALNGITTSGYTLTQSMSITCVKEGKVGSTNVDEFDDGSMRKAVKNAEQLAMIAPPNPERVAPLGPQKYDAMENFPLGTVKARNDVMIPHVRAIIEAAKKSSLVAAGLFDRTATIAAIANKAGNFGFGRTTDSSLSTTIRTADGSSSGWASMPAVRIEEINGGEVARIAIEKALRWKNPKRLEPGKYTVVLEPTAVGDLVPQLAFSLLARGAEEGRSFLSKQGGGTRLGEKLFPEMITLRSDPLNKLFSVMPWGGGGGGGFGGGGGGRGGRGGGGGVGEPARPMTWIEKGVLKNLVYDRYWASKTGQKATPFPGNLVLDGGEKTLEQLIASVERGLLVTRFWYIRSVNPQTVQLTGLTRDGLFLVENGKVTGAVVNFRFNESPVRLLQNAVAAGVSRRVRGGEGQGMIAPAMVVKDFNFASVSDAV
ncbi:MAG: TldD/PmbA family protein [Acidobacteria bacterium]|nr:TldD/PmbA family protein [Acidobacteriota bacterium]